MTDGPDSQDVLSSNYADDLSVQAPTFASVTQRDSERMPRSRRSPTGSSAVLLPVGNASGEAQPAGLGAVFTRRWAVDLVLDLAGYTSEKDLAHRVAVEPSCGDGAFLIAMIDRLAESCDRTGIHLGTCGNAIAAWDLNPRSVSAARDAARERLIHHGLSPDEANHLARVWVRERDFLLDEIPACDWVVGNPPYVRLEDVPTSRSQAYRQRWNTMRGRADVYVGFIQAGLEALKDGGVLSYICADRWMRNQYGLPLRRLIEGHYAVDTIVTLHDSDPFEAKVAAYPAIFSIRSGKQGPALIVDANSSFGAHSAEAVAKHHRLDPHPDHSEPITEPHHDFAAAWSTAWFASAPSWPAGRPDRLALVAELENNFPALADPEGHARIGIGLASGADRIYLTTDTSVVEPEHLLPLVMAKDLQNGEVVWSGRHLVNPWTPDGQLVDIAGDSKTAAYFRRHKAALRKRHVAQRQPDRWHRTIDRPIAGLAETPKLLMPDLRHRVLPVLDTNGLYPHHNLYWITSDTWDLRVLGGLLMSDFGNLFVETYSPRMAGGALRVTAQYLRRIRVPNVDALDQTTSEDLADAFTRNDVPAATRAAARAYGVKADVVADLSR